MSAPTGAPKVALIGFMGAGKTTAARLLGDRARDLDAVIQEKTGQAVHELFEREGEGAFRELEERTTLELLDDPSVSAIALGGGAINSEKVRGALSGDVRTIWLDVELESAWERTRSAPAQQRPLAQDRKRFEQLHAERRPVYEQLADVILPATRSRAIAEVVEALQGLPAKGTTVLWATTPSGDYPAYIGRGLLTELHFWPRNIEGRRIVISDYNAARHYGETLEPALASIRITPGEQSKTIAHAEIVWTEMVRHGTTRGDVVAALGGGVVGDLAGFCAATYQRGMRVVQVPTTLVAQVDSAYGGKTGVDLPEAKNYVGSFHQPAAVLADTGTLQTLPREELAAGYAEVVKTALIAGGSLWDRVRGGAPPDDPEVIAGCALTKLRVVAEDEKDTGLRQLLNLGHTIGHAIETATGYARYRHGEAVGLGMLAALRLSGADDLRSEVMELLHVQGLPVRLEDADVDAVIFATARDKKRIGEGPVPFVLCPEPGRLVFGQQVAPAEVRAAVTELID